VACPAGRWRKEAVEAAEECLRAQVSVSHPALFLYLHAVVSHYEMVPRVVIAPQARQSTSNATVCIVDPVFSIFPSVLSVLFMAVREPYLAPTEAFTEGCGADRSCDAESIGRCALSSVGKKMLQAAFP